MVEKTYDRVMDAFLVMSDMEIEIIKRRKQLMMMDEEED